MRKELSLFLENPQKVAEGSKPDVKLKQLTCLEASLTNNHQETRTVVHVAHRYGRQLCGPARPPSRTRLPRATRSCRCFPQAGGDWGRADATEGTAGNQGAPLLEEGRAALRGSLESRDPVQSFPGTSRKGRLLVFLAGGAGCWSNFLLKL